jgi:dipeptide transport system ATP-binding protein
MAETAHRVMVMYAGQMVEEAQTEHLFAAPRHPYTAALLAALPERALDRQRMPTIPGVVPGIDDRPAGCVFHPRCGFAAPLCSAQPPGITGGGTGRVRCYYPLAEPA